MRLLNEAALRQSERHDHPYFQSRLYVKTITGDNPMNSNEQQRYNALYEQYLTNLTLQGKRPATMDAYSRAVRRTYSTHSCWPRCGEQE